MTSFFIDFQWPFDAHIIPRRFQVARRALLLDPNLLTPPGRAQRASERSERSERSDHDLYRALRFLAISLLSPLLLFLVPSWTSFAFFYLSSLYALPVQMLRQVSFRPRLADLFLLFFHVFFKVFWSPGDAKIALCWTYVGARLGRRLGAILGGFWEAKTATRRPKTATRRPKTRQ